MFSRDEVVARGPDGEGGRMISSLMMREMEASMQTLVRALKGRAPSIIGVTGSSKPPSRKVVMPLSRRPVVFLILYNKK